VRVPALVAWGMALATSSGALASDGDAWARAISPNRVFSVETPCGAAEVAKAQQVPDSALKMGFTPRSRVLCRKGKLLFVAGEVRDTRLPAGARSLFDLVSSKTRTDPTAEGVPSSTKTDGRRTFVTRQVDADSLAQTGLVEVNATTIIVVVAGIQAESGLSDADRAATVDRFFKSIKVAGK
jgi:hypothetical protein